MVKELKLSESEELAMLISPIVNIVDTVLAARGFNSINGKSTVSNGGDCFDS